MTLSPPTSLISAITQACFEAYTPLPNKGKPHKRDNGRHEWTILAGFCLYAVDGAEDGMWDVKCVSLGSGLKVLPHARLPPHGDVLHDSHAEIIARRGFVLYLYDQLEEAKEGRESCLEKTLGKEEWSLRSGLRVGMYVSTLPCGDASTYSLSLLAPPSPPLKPTSTLPSTISTLPSTLFATSLGLATSRSPLPSSSAPTPQVHRGRISYTTLSTLRTKPGRLDSPPTTSHSCSDKLCLWSAVGVQGGLLSSLGVGRIVVEVLVVGGVAEEERERVGEEVRRAVGGRLEGWKCEGWDVKVPEVGFAESEFEGAKDVTAKRGGVDMESLVSCTESLSFVQGQGCEVIANGLRQGAKSKRKPGEALGHSSRSRISKLGLFTRHASLLDVLLPTYHSVKHSATQYQAAKASLRARGAPLEGWLISGRAYESFEVDGRLSSEVEVEGTKRI